MEETWTAIEIKKIISLIQDEGKSFGEVATIVDRKESSIREAFHLLQNE